MRGTSWVFDARRASTSTLATSSIDRAAASNRPKPMAMTSLAVSKASTYDGVASIHGTFSFSAQAFRPRKLLVASADSRQHYSSRILPQRPIRATTVSGKTGSFVQDFAIGRISWTQSVRKYYVWESLDRQETSLGSSPYRKILHSIARATSPSTKNPRSDSREPAQTRLRYSRHFPKRDLESLAQTHRSWRERRPVGMGDNAPRPVAVGRDGDLQVVVGHVARGTSRPIRRTPPRRHRRRWR